MIIIIDVSFDSDIYKTRVLELNASDERGIQVQCCYFVYLQMHHIMMMMIVTSDGDYHDFTHYRTVLRYNDSHLLKLSPFI